MARLKPLNDVIFKKIFGQKNDKEYLISFLNSVLSANIKDVDILPETLPPEKLDDKVGIMDIKAFLDTGEKVNIEVQLINPHNMRKRTLFYWSKLYLENFKIGDNYNQLFKTITINILGYNEFEDDSSFLSSFHIYEDNTGRKLNDDLEIHFIELSKFKKLKYDKHNPLHRWLLFLQEDIEHNVLEEIIEMDELIRKAEDKLEALNYDPETLREYELREKFLRDEASRMSGAKEEGKKEGIEEGKEAGEYIKAIKVAKKMIVKGETNEAIHEFTELSLEEINKLRESMK